MIQRFIENKRPLRALLIENNFSLEFSINKWILLEQLEETLYPLEEATKSLEFENACISQVLPMLSLLKSFYNSPLNGELIEIRRFRESIRNSIDERFSNYEHSE